MECMLHIVAETSGLAHVYAPVPLCMCWFSSPCKYEAAHEGVRMYNICCRLTCVCLSTCASRSLHMREYVATYLINLRF